MSDFFLELYSEEIPHNLQISARKQLEKLIKNELEQKNIQFENFKMSKLSKKL